MNLSIDYLTLKPGFFGLSVYEMIQKTRPFHFSQCMVLIPIKQDDGNSKEYIFMEEDSFRHNAGIVYNGRSYIPVDSILSSICSHIGKLYIDLLESAESAPKDRERQAYKLIALEIGNYFFELQRSIKQARSIEIINTIETSINDLLSKLRSMRNRPQYSSYWPDTMNSTIEHLEHLIRE